MDTLFCLINEKSEKTLTARGYFQSILKNLTSELNPQVNYFIRLLKRNSEKFIFPLIKNLTRANSEIIKDLLCNENEKLKKL